MQPGRSLVLIAKGEQNRQALSGQLNDLLRGRVQVRSLCVDKDFSPSLLEGDLIVVASEPIRRDVERYLAGRTNVIVARRTIDLRNLHLLLRLPPHTKAMLVNDRKETAEEVISLLYGMGFTDFWFIPVYPDLENIPRVDIAVTPGEPHLVPSHVKKIVDLGCRIIDVTTLTEILLRLDLLDEKAHLLSARFLNQAIEISKKLVQSLKDNQDLNQLLATVLNKVNDGVLAIDATGKTLLYNQAAEKFFKIPARQVVGQRLQDLLPWLAPERPLQQDKSDENSSELYREHKILVNRILLKDGNDHKQGVVITFSELGALQKIERQLKNNPHHAGFVAKYTFNDIQGKSPALQECLEKARYFAATDLTVLITGPTGTGKELLAHAIHNASSRCLKPFVAVNCAALPKDLLESELFGYEEGAFTGARRGGKAGLLEQANGGTIFLDEIGDMPLALQAKLLRVLEEREIMRIGAERVITIDVRVIAATNQNLRELAANGSFRQDLYYRLNTFTVELPALQERPEDIPLLIAHFLKKWGREPEQFLTPGALATLLRYPWPGNIRELRNVVDYLATVCRGRQVEIHDLPPDLQQKGTSEDKAFSDVPAWMDLVDIIGEDKKFNSELAILQILSHLNGDGQGLGRQQLVQKLAERGLRFTEDMVRTRLKYLAGRGLVQTGRGRQGTRITARGREVLAKLC
ncbi:MAG: sigma-54 dependent transcriptional regulator, acetoin dehydrogenase operon transcriptional [Clostridia bacterium]|nr:sigma-54 dependent transcriptional regulator, acetoin dehydrogenase operon transcriptional [Clostridia bacterium]